jgi:AraC-like DNA-binding protein
MTGASRARLSTALAIRLAAAHTFIKRHFRRTPSLVEIARRADLSPFYFHRLFRCRYGKTPKQMILDLKIAEVKRLVRKGIPLAEASRATGFSHHSHMSLRFKTAVGVTPRKWLLMSRKGMVPAIVYWAYAGFPVDLINLACAAA